MYPPKDFVTQIL